MSYVYGTNSSKLNSQLLNTHIFNYISAHVDLSPNIKHESYLRERRGGSIPSGLSRFSFTISGPSTI